MALEYGRDHLSPRPGRAVEPSKDPLAESPLATVHSERNGAPSDGSGAKQHQVALSEVAWCDSGHLTGWPNAGKNRGSSADRSRLCAAGSKSSSELSSVLQVRPGKLHAHKAPIS